MLPVDNVGKDTLQAAELVAFIGRACVFRVRGLTPERVMAVANYARLFVVDGAFITFSGPVYLQMQGSPDSAHDGNYLLGLNHDYYTLHRVPKLEIWPKVLVEAFDAASQTYLIDTDEIHLRLLVERGDYLWDAGAPNDPTKVHRVRKGQKFRISNGAEYEAVEDFARRVPIFKPLKSEGEDASDEPLDPYLTIEMLIDGFHKH